MDKKNLKIVNHPLIFHNLSIIRDKNTTGNIFRSSAKKIAELLLYKAIKNLPMKEIEIETPLTKTKCQVIDESKEIFIASILRAGLLISEVAADIVPHARIQHIGMCRNEETFCPDWYYNKLPNSFKNPKDTLLYICDPMLATGGSALETIKLYIEKGLEQKNMTFISIISAPEGIKRIHNEFPDITIITAAVDEKLNEKAYIVPGLGDAGDRIFNTIY